MRPTIVGVATGSPDGGVAIVRLSGPRAGAIAAELGGELPAPRHLGRRSLRLDRDGDSNEVGGGLEDALVAFMPGPNSFTGEDVVELHVHGGGVNVSEVVGACLELGAQAAGPGDFSRRAFEHGRLSLAQSEGIAALIGAKTRAGAAQARRLVAGELGAQVRERADAIARLRTEVEAYLDFPEDVDERITRDWRERLETQAGGIEGWLSTFEAARRARELCRVVLAGPPNAGKSSLMNALLGQSRALVADQPGTTRDFVDARMELGRYAVQLVDTAGLRDASEDAVELAGMRLSKAQLEGADLLLWISPQGDATGDLPVSAGAHGEVWRVRSKTDLEANDVGAGEVEGEFDFGVSVNAPESVNDLRERLHDWVRGQSQQPWVGLARHRDRAQGALAALRESADLIGTQAGVELLAFSLQVAQARLDEIEGRRRLGPVGAEVLDAIFSNFCIGK